MCFQEDLARGHLFVQPVENEAVEAALELIGRLAGPRSHLRGVRKFRSIGEANAEREARLVESLRARARSRPLVPRRPPGRS